MPMQLGSKEHKAQFCKQLIQTYFENIWQDEMHLIQLEEDKGDKRKELAAIELKLDRKEFPSKNEGEKEKFVVEREIVHLDKEIEAVTDKVKNLWPARIQMVKNYLDKK